MTTMLYVIDGVRWQEERPPETPTFLSSRHGYLVASIGGAMVPYGVEHLVGKMGGLWFHPLRIGTGWQLRLNGVPCVAAVRCTVHADRIERVYDLPGRQIVVTERMDDALAALLVGVLVTNTTDTPVHDRWEICIDAAVEGCWFGGMNAGQTVAIGNDERVSGVCASGGDIRAGAVVAALAEIQWKYADGLLCGRTEQQMGAQTTTALHWGIAVDHEQSPNTVSQQLLRRLHDVATGRAPQPAALPTLLLSTDADLDAYWRVACQNLGALRAEYPGMPSYALAGIPEYPQFFGCDTTYAIPGLLAAGYAQVAQHALDGLAVYAQAACGRVPHEVTTNGRVYHPGNAQETPQYAVACWQYVCWTGDIAAAQRWYAICAEGMAHVSGVLDGVHWPYGDGMVERHGMGPFKLDSVCYIIQALDALAPWATLVGRTADAARWAEARARLAQRFDSDWWMEQDGLYADSLQRDGARQLDYHWTAIVPVQTGIAPHARQNQVYQRVKATLTNEWGLMHTAGVEASVWTLPTGLLALAACAQDDAPYAMTLLRNIGQTARHGSLGLLKELIPEGLCFVQLWSAALYCQGVVEGLLGIVPYLPERRIVITPRVPTMAITGLHLGSAVVDVAVEGGVIRITHHAGQDMLHWETGTHPLGTTAVGQTVAWRMD